MRELTRIRELSEFRCSHRTETIALHTVVPLISHESYLQIHKYRCNWKAVGDLLRNPFVNFLRKWNQFLWLHLRGCDVHDRISSHEHYG